MSIRNILFLAGLAILLAGCVIHSRPYPPRDYDDRYYDDYYDYRSTPSYEGYYYVRIIFISDVPYYVDDDRYVRPIPPRLREHFRRYRYDALGRPPIFSRDREVRDGYPVSRIIYLDGVPYHVGDDRRAQPLPERLRPHFRYAPEHPGNAPANSDRPQPPVQRDNDRGRDQREPPPYEHGQRDGGNIPPADNQDRTPRDKPGMLLHQLQHDTGNTKSDTPDGKGRDHNRSQTAGDTGQKTDKKGSSSGKKDKQVDSGKKDDSPKDDGKNERGNKSRHGDATDQENSDRSNVNR